MKLNKTMTISIVMLSIVALLVPMAVADKPIVKQVTGGGWIVWACTGEDKKTFGFNAEELSDGSLKGSLEYVDHGMKMNVHGYEITSLVISEGNHADIWGLCRVNGNNLPYQFHVYVIDRNEPGKHDWFEIRVFPGIGEPFYWAANELGFPEDAGGGGNIVVHVPLPP